MEAYKTPVSDVEVSAVGEFRPARAVIYGLLVTIVLGGIVSLILGAVFAVVEAESFTTEAEMAAALAGNAPFLLADIVLTVIILYIAGVVVRKYAVGHEIKYALIVCGITLLVFFPMFVISEGIEIYPFWYNAISFMAIPIVLIIAAKPRKS